METTRQRIGFIVVAMCLLMPAAAHARTIALAWDPSPDNDVTGYLISYGTQPGMYTDSVDIGNLLSYQLDLPGDQYYFAICAYDAAGARSPFSNEAAESSVIALMNPGDQRDGAAASVSLQLAATGSPASYTAAGLPGGLGIDSSTGRISGVIDSGAAASSPYLVRASVSDASGHTSSVQFTWTVAGVNRAPAVTQPANQTSAAGSAVTLAIIASDPDGDALTFSAAGLPPGLSINATSGVIGDTIAADAAGTYNVAVTASDGSLATNRTFTWTVTSGSNNRAPSLTAPSNQTSLESATVSLQLAGSDPDGDVLTYVAAGLPPSLTINTASGLISGTLSYTSAGTYSVTVTASDGSLSTSQTFTWTVTAVNRAPALTSPGNQTSTEIASVSLQLAASDPDGDALTYGAAGLPPSLTINTATGLISGTLSPASAGTYSVTATASDGNLSQSSTFTWTVTVNRAPALPSPGDQTSAENATVSLQLAASDPDGDAVTYGAAGLPPSLTINTASGLISGRLSYTSAGTYSVTVTASDGSLSISQTFTWTVTNVNRAPALTAPPNQTSAESAAVSLQLAASDPDGDALIYGAAGLPPALTLNTSTGLISGTLSYTSAGTYTVTVTASDGSLATSRTFTWTVTNVNRAPTLASLGNQTSAVATTVTVPLVASDADGDALTFSAAGLPTGLSINAVTGVISGTVLGVPGSYQVTVTVSDGRVSTSQTFTWSVTLL